MTPWRRSARPGRIPLLPRWRSSGRRNSPQRAEARSPPKLLGLDGGLRGRSSCRGTGAPGPAETSVDAVIVAPNVFLPDRHHGVDRRRRLPERAADVSAAGDEPVGRADGGGRQPRGGHRDRRRVPAGRRDLPKGNHPGGDGRSITPTSSSRTWWPSAPSCARSSRSTSRWRSPRSLAWSRRDGDLSLRVEPLGWPSVQPGRSPARRGGVLNRL